MNVEVNRKNTTGMEASLSEKLPALTAGQSVAYEKLKRILEVNPTAGLMGGSGSGRTLVADWLAREKNGVRLSMTEIVATTSIRAAASWEDATREVIVEALNKYDLVILDNYNNLASVGSRSSTHPNYFTRIVMLQVFESVAAQGKHLVLLGSPPQLWESAGDIYGDMTAVVGIPAVTAEDYKNICSNILGDKVAEGIDFKLVLRFSSNLNGHQLRTVFSLLDTKKKLTADDVIECLETYVITSNTRTDEVEPITFDQLPGAEHIVEALETNIVLPLENRKLAQELGLKPKRGVLLYGPPGTGKTSIGRALAHRMKGKFFIIDGSFISEPPKAFFDMVQKVVNDAKESAPSVLFIDDADVLFAINHIAGLSRYLLSLLDGLESETASNVCVMMTAMDVRKIPDALLRSGRVELWLETKAPDAATRARMLERWMGKELPEHERIDFVAVTSAVEGFTPADLRRIAEDAKSLYAADIVRGRQVTTASDYLNQAVKNVVTVRDRMAEILKDDSLRVRQAKPIGEYGSGNGGAAQMGTCEAKGW